MLRRSKAKDGTVLHWVYAGLLFLLPLSVALGADPDLDLSNEEITDALKTELAVEPGVLAHRIDVETANGVVTLEGTVSNLLARERAAEIALTVKGVRSVINRIIVSPAPRPDNEIRRDIENALLRNPATEILEVDVEVSDATATLTGKVDSWQEKQLATTVAKSVTGLKEVKDELLTQLDAERPDPEIQTEVEEVLRWDARVDDALIDVSVDNGAVVLSGVVGSAAERARAEKDAWVRGVRTVDVQNLEIESWARDERFRKEKYANISDSEVKEAVEDSFIYDPRVNAFDPKVKVEDGVVTLSGTVSTLLAKEAAADDARNVVGVIRVKNHLDVRPTERRPDPEIEREVETALELDPYLEARTINVSVQGGDVYLYGTVDNAWEKMRAADRAAEVKSVVYVDNNLRVNGFSDEERAAGKEDWEIREDIRDQLFWSPFVDSDDVNVAVDNGVATLTGTVDTWAERQAARENALEGGAVAVRNELGVESAPETFYPY